MKKLMASSLAALSIGVGALAPLAANAQSLGTCLVDSLSGKERKELAKWIYFAMAAHPDITAYAKVTESDRLNTDKYIGSLITRLLVENCPAELTAAQKADPLAMKKAFELVGQVAMQELMTNGNVVSAISGYVRHADQKKISSVMADRQ